MSKQNEKTMAVSDAYKVSHKTASILNSIKKSIDAYDELFEAVASIYGEEQAEEILKPVHESFSMYNKSMGGILVNVINESLMAKDSQGMI